jgi:putative endonuclease
MKPGFVYIMTNKNNTVLYTGVTSNLPKRVNEHKEHFFELSFTSKYNADKLVYWESFQEIGDAIFREKQIKAGSRKKKINLINSINPEWRDLTEDIKDIMSPF